MTTTSGYLEVRDIVNETIGTLGPNYPYSHLQKFAIAIIFFFPVIATIIVSLRIYSRIITKSFGWDDVLIITALGFSIASTVPSYFFIKAAYVGVHDGEVPLGTANTPYFFWTWLVQALYQPILSAVKASVLLFLLRLGGTKTGFRWTCWALIAFNALLMFGLFFANIFQCDPVAKYWRNSRTFKGTCIKMSVFTMFVAYLNIVTDLVTIILPFVIFLGLRMHRRVKVALIVVFSSGFLVTIMSCLRAYYVYRSFYMLDRIPDKHYSIGFVTSAAETNLAIITASVPALWPLARRWFPGVFARIRVSRAFKQDELPDINELGAQRRRAWSWRSWMSKESKSSGGSRCSQQYGIYASHTIGGGSFRNFRGDGAAQGKTEILTGGLRGSLEEMIAKKGGIMRTASILIKYDDWFDEPLSPGLANLEAVYPARQPKMDPAYFDDDYHRHIREEARKRGQKEVPGMIEDIC